MVYFHESETALRAGAVTVKWCVPSSAVKLTFSELELLITMAKEPSGFLKAVYVSPLAEKPFVPIRTAHQKGNSGDTGQQNRHHVACGIHHLRQFLLGTDFKIILFVIRYLVIFMKHFRYRIDDFIGFIFVLSACINALKIIYGEDTLHYCRVWRKYNIVLIHTHGIGPF